MSSPTPSQDDPQTFTGQVVLGRYHVVLPLGAGGQGMVHLARAEGAAGVARPVVIKRVHAPLANDKLARSRFIHEARITARLRHPDIVSIVEFERESDNSYLMVLEYVHGYDLWRWARFVHGARGAVPAKLLAYVTTRVLDALHYSHSLRDPDGSPTPIIHRDVSAGNVLIDVSGHVKLTDFGIAAVLSPGKLSEPEQGLQGKLGYIAPELFRGAAPSVETDIYACAVMLHTLLRGVNEFQAGDVRTAEIRARDHIPTRLDTVRKDVPKEAANVIAKALAKAPEQRFRSAYDFSGELRRAFSLDVAEAREELARVVERDFDDPAFAKTLGVLSLRHVDAAWRKQEDVPTDSLKPGRYVTPSLFPRISMSPREPTRALGKAKNEGTSARRRRSRFETLGWSFAVALLVALVVTVVGLRMNPSGAQRVLYVEAQPHQQELSGTPPQLVEPTTGPKAAEPTERANQPRAVKPNSKKPALETPSEPGAVLTERFAQRRKEVSDCFRTHASDQKLSRVLVAFEIDPKGQVEKAELDPPDLAPSPLGRCVLAIARSTRFGAQQGYLRFRIPISAQTYQNEP